MNIQTAFLILAIIGIVLFLLTRKKSAPVNASGWHLGPFIDGENITQGTEFVQEADGVSFTIPINGSVHYVTRVPDEPLKGKTQIRMRYRFDRDPGARVHPPKFPDAPALITLFMQRKGDDWSAVGFYEAYRWYAGFGTQKLITAGEYELVAPLDGPWGAVLSSTRENNQAAFDDVLTDTGRIGFVLGGGDGLGHGIRATGPAKLTILSFEVL